MADPRLLIALRRIVYFTQNLDQCVAYGLGVCQCRMFSIRKKSILDETNNDDAPKERRRKTEPVPKITLLSPDNNTFTVTDLENAQRLAKRRKFTLVKVSDVDNKTQRPLYKFVNSSSVLEDLENIEDIDKAREKFKDVKLLYISAKISEHDLLTKTKNMMKLLKKGHKIKIVINLDDIKEDRVQRIIEDAVKHDGSTQKMSSKKNVVLLLITPLLNKNNGSSVVNKKETVIPNTIHQNNNT